MGRGDPGHALRNPVGVLAIQGSFALHMRALTRCSVAVREVRTPRDLEQLAGLVIPGGESTTMVHLAKEYGLFIPIREMGKQGLPLLGTCAGAVLIGRGEERPERLGLVDIDVERNAYGRQVDSFTAELDLVPLDTPFHGVFIRAPKLRIPNQSSDIDVLGRYRDNPVLVRCGSILISTFHPELTDDLRVHELFLAICESGSSAGRGGGPT